MVHMMAPQRLGRKRSDDFEFPTTGAYGLDYDLLPVRGASAAEESFGLCPNKIRKWYQLGSDDVTHQTGISAERIFVLLGIACTLVATTDAMFELIDIFKSTTFPIALIELLDVTVCV